MFSQCQSWNAEQQPEQAAAALGLCTVTLTGSDTATAEEADGRGSPRGTTVSEIKTNLSQQSERVCFRAKNTGISLPLMLKDVFFPEPLDLKAVPPASIWLPRRTCTSNSQRWNVFLVPLNDFPIHRFCLWQRIMICPVVTFVKSRTLRCQLSDEHLCWWTPQQ